MLDTGSANLAVAGPAVRADSLVFRAYDPKRASLSRWWPEGRASRLSYRPLPASAVVSSTAVKTKRTFEVDYVQGKITGDVYRDTVSIHGLLGNRSSRLPSAGLGRDALARVLGSSPTFGVMNSAAAFFPPNAAGLDEPYEGILGLGFASIAVGGIPPWFDGLVAQGLVPDVFALKLCDNGATVSTDSLLVLGDPAGAADPALLVPPALANTTVYTPLGSRGYYAVTVTSLRVGDADLGLPCAAFNTPAPAIVDSGSTDIIVPPSVRASCSPMG